MPVVLLTSVFRTRRIIERIFSEWEFPKAHVFFILNKVTKMAVSYHTASKPTDSPLFYELVGWFEGMGMGEQTATAIVSQIERECFSELIAQIPALKTGQFNTLESHFKSPATLTIVVERSTPITAQPAYTRPRRRLLP